MVGTWATLALNITDFTRYAKSQKSQAIGQLIGLPLTTVFISFLGIFVTSATKIIYGKAIWNPVDLLAQIDSVAITVIGLIIVTIATLSTNVAANVVSPANALQALNPKLLGFRSSGIITGIIGIIIMPWKFLKNPTNFIEKWLISSSILMGAFTGIMLVDYWILRKRELDLNELYKNNGGVYQYYYGWNWRAFLATFYAVLVVVPGLLHTFGFLPDNDNISWIYQFYNYSWFICGGIGALFYWLFMRCSFTILVPSNDNLITLRTWKI